MDISQIIIDHIATPMARDLDSILAPIVNKAGPNAELAKRDEDDGSVTYFVDNNAVLQVGPPESVVVDGKMTVSQSVRYY